MLSLFFGRFFSFLLSCWAYYFITETIYDFSSMAQTIYSINQISNILNLNLQFLLLNKFWKLFYPIEEKLKIIICVWRNRMILYALVYTEFAKFVHRINLILTNWRIIWCALSQHAVCNLILLNESILFGRPI